VIPKKSIKSFKADYKEIFGVELTDEVVMEHAITILNWFRILTTPYTETRLGNAKMPKV
jgi:hypothetical protein